MRDDQFANAVSASGHHLTNIRLPSRLGSSGGVHVHTDEGFDGYGIHYDVFNPVNGFVDMYRHGREVGFNGLGNGFPGNNNVMASQTFLQYCGGR